MSVVNFLQAASLTYESLLELLEVSWVQGGLGVFTQASDTCDTTQQRLLPADHGIGGGFLDPDFLDRAQRFLRLWRATGYTMWELDMLLAAPAVGSGALDDAMLAALLCFKRLQDATRLPVDAQLAFFQVIDTARHRDPSGAPSTSLYARLFLNPSRAAVDPALAAIGTAGPVEYLNGHLPAIQAGLGVSASDAEILFGLTDQTLSLDNLSRCYRVTALAKAAILTISDLLAIAQLLSPGSSQGAAIDAIFASPDTVLQFLEQATATRQSHFTVDGLTYVLSMSSTVSGMTIPQITATLTAVQNAIIGAAGVNEDGVVIAAVAANAHTPSEPPLANDVTALILETLHLAPPVPAFSLLKLLKAATLTTEVGGVLPTVTQAAFPDQFAAIQMFDKAATVARTLRLIASDLAWLMANANVYGGLDFLLLPVQGPPVLPVWPPLPPPPVPTLERLLTTLQLIGLARQFTAAPPASPIQTLYDVISGISTGMLQDEFHAQEALATVTGWPATDVSVFAGPTALNLSFAGADYLKPRTYDALRKLEAMAITAKATAAQVTGWAVVPNDEPTAEALAQSALGVVKANLQDNEAWLAAAPALMDPLRDRRSSALQAYLIGLRDSSNNLVFPDANALFDYFLIDVQMTSCQTTTRVVQAYIAVQIFVERCLMNLEEPQVTVNLDDTWSQWRWMKRFRIWQANREVFLYPENWLVESQRPNRTEIFQHLEQVVRQGKSTADYLESTVLDYIDGLDGIAHLQVTGTCQDPATGAVYVVARSVQDPPVFYVRYLIAGAWDGWTRIPLDIKARHAVPAIYRGRLCLFWLQVTIGTEPKQTLSPISATSSNDVAKYVVLTPCFSVFRNGSWAPSQSSKGTLFDKPTLDSTKIRDAQAVEALYTIKVQTTSSASTYGTSLLLDIFRMMENQTWLQFSWAEHIARASFDGRFNDLELTSTLLSAAQSTYGPDALSLLPLIATDPILGFEANLSPQGGALVTSATTTGGTLPLAFSPLSTMQQNVQPLLKTAPLPFRVVGPATDVSFDPRSYFFFQESRRSYYVESFVTDLQYLFPTYPMYQYGVTFDMMYVFHPFYHPFTRTFWHQLSSIGFPALFDRNLQQFPDHVDLSGSDVFAFQTGYQPSTPTVAWDHDDFTGQDRQFLDFRPSAAFGVYNWELFFHVPLFIAELLSQNLQFEDALTWYRYIFDPALNGTDPVPQRYWIPKPLATLTTQQVQQSINQLLLDIEPGTPAPAYNSALAQVLNWRVSPFNPFQLADQRPVAYMKRTVMSYIDNLIAWADNLFATDSREALSQATLLYTTASELLGPTPTAVEPPQHIDESFDDLEPHLDAFANALVDIENVVDGTIVPPAPGVTLPQTLYFKIPPNDKLLGYWATVADRLSKLRHCQDLQGSDLVLALFDAPIDPGLLVAAQTAGVDLASVLSGVSVDVPNYRFTALYRQALDFVDAVRQYGAALQEALEKADDTAVRTLQGTLQLQLLADTAQMLDLQRQRAEATRSAVDQAWATLEQKLAYLKETSASDKAEDVETGLDIAATIATRVSETLLAGSAASEWLPTLVFGSEGTTGTPTALEKAAKVSDAQKKWAEHFESAAKGLERAAAMAKKLADYLEKREQKAQLQTETANQIEEVKARHAAADLAVQIALANQTLNQERADHRQRELDFVEASFTSQGFYQWMTQQLSATYFTSYQLAFRLCKQVEACYQFELGSLNTPFIQFGYWDSLYKGLLAGEALANDLRRMQSSYLDRNRRRLEISRYVSLRTLDPDAMRNLILQGDCFFDLSETLFDGDYPGHYNRRLTRVSATVVYPEPARFDNVKGALTLAAAKARVDPSTDAGYPEQPFDPRFSYSNPVVSQQIAFGDA